MQCPRCGAENSDSATFCGLCYAKFAASQPATHGHRSELGPPAVAIVQGDGSKANELPPEPPQPEPPPQERPAAGPPDVGALPDSPGARQIREAEELLEAGMPEAAFERFESAARTYQCSGVANSTASEIISHGLARSLIAQGRPQDAASHYLNVLRVRAARVGIASPEIAADWNRIGDTFMLAKSWDEAAQMYAFTIKLDSSHAERIHAFARQADCYEALGRTDEALAARQTAETIRARYR